MKIGIITTSFPQDLDDPSGNFVLEHAQWLADQGHQIHVLAAGNTHPDKPCPSFHPAITVSRVPFHGELFYQGGAPDHLLDLKKNTRHWLSALRFMWTLKKHIKQHLSHCDRLIAHWLLPSGFIAHSVFPNKPILMIAHGGDVYLAKTLHLTSYLTRVFNKKNIHIVFVAQSLQDLFLKQTNLTFKQQTSVVPMGIDVHRFTILPKQINTKPKVVFLGRLVPIKGVHVFLKALTSMTSPVEVIIAGDGPQKNTLETYVKQHNLNVHFTGFLHGKKRDDFLASADILVIPSIVTASGRTEGTPRVALEAMASSTAIIASDVGGLSSFPSNVITRVPPNDDHILALSLEQCLLQSHHRHQQIKIAKQWVTAYDWNVIGDTLEKNILTSLE